MPGRDFEKAIQEKAQELRLDPSPAVWQGVAEQLKQRRRKRGVAWLLLAAAVITGIAVVWFAPEHVIHSRDGQSTIASGNDKKNQTSPNKSPIEANSTLSNKTDSQSEQPGSAAADAQPDASNSVTGRMSGTVKPVPPATVPGSQSFVAGKSAKNRPATNVLVARNQRKNNSTELTTEAASLTTTTEKKVAGHDRQVTAKDSYATSVAPAAAPRSIDPADINGINPFDLQITVLQPESNSGDRTIKSGIVKLDPSRKKGWYPSIHLVLGASSLQEDVLKQYNTFANEYQNTTMIPTGLAAPQRRPSDVKTGPAFQVGMNINRYFGNKVSVGAGIHYAYLSNRIEIGSPVDSAYYDNRQQQMVTRTAYNGSGNNGESFHNRYHLIQVPVEFNWNIDRKEKLSWNAGVAVGYLVGSDAMQYNKQAGVYYRDNDALRKWQAGVFSGIQYNFLEAKGIRYSAGPFVQYQLTSLEVDHTNKHQLFVGVGGRMHLKKIK